MFRQVKFTRPVAGVFVRDGEGTSTSTVILWLKPKNSSIFAAATFPAATALITVAGPETASPPAKTFLLPGTKHDFSAWIAPRFVKIPLCSKCFD